MKTFDSFASFALHLGVIAAENTIKSHEELKVVSKYLEKKIKDRFGHYIRENIGQFEAWKELAPSTKSERERLGYPPNEPLLRSGGLRDTIKSEVKGLTAVIGSDSDIMVWQELGTSRIPPRSALGTEAYNAKHEIYKFIALTTTKRLSGHNEKTEI